VSLPALNPDVIRRGLDAAIEQAEKSWKEGGIPIGSSLLDASGKVVAAGHNMRVQSGDPTAHAEVSCVRNAGRRRDWRRVGRPPERERRPTELERRPERHRPRRAPRVGARRQPPRRRVGRRPV
jgi:hypothetical protein